MDHKLDDIRKIIDTVTGAGSWLPKHERDDEGMLDYDGYVNHRKSGKRAIAAVMQIRAILMDEALPDIADDAS